jgi:asparagine synthase (glutamine-hydrolysing)
MSAIAGIMNVDEEPIDIATLQRMKTLLTPYGRDAQNILNHGSIALIRTLLRITHEDFLDHQPLVDRSSGISLVFDGRIDNRDELCHKFGISSNEASLQSDSELVLKACIRWDTNAVKHLLGDFAFACWQAPQRRLWLARDPIGMRPLFWHRQASFVAFATMPKALFAIPGVPRALCEEWLHDYLCLLPMVGATSMFKDIYRVEPGQVAIFDTQRTSLVRYHSYDSNYVISLPSDNDYLDAFNEQLNNAIARRLRSHGAIASHLSSGFDSSTVTALAATQLLEKDSRLLAYTSVPREGFDGPVPKGKHADEGPGARALADRFPNIDHFLIRIGDTSPIESLHADTEMMDRGILNPCNMVWAKAIQDHASSQGAKVLLSGQMGNATISYDGLEYLPELLSSGHFKVLLSQVLAIKSLHPNITWKAVIATTIAPFFPPSLWRIYQRVRGNYSKLTSYSAISPAFMERIGTQVRAKRLNFDLTYTMPWANGRRKRIAMLTKRCNGEYFAAANIAGLEIRDPTADLRLVEFCLSLPTHLYLRDGTTKWLLRHLMRYVLPPQILDTSTKGLQSADWYEATSRDLPLIREEISSLQAHAHAPDYLDLTALKHLVDNWPSSGWDNPEIDDLYRIKLLRGLSVGSFIQYAEPSNLLTIQKDE